MAGVLHTLPTARPGHKQQVGQSMLFGGEQDFFGVIHQDGTPLVITEQGFKPLPEGEFLLGRANLRGTDNAVEPGADGGLLQL